MTVYVDELIHPWRGKKWCHLFADNEEELHRFAAKLFLKRTWFQNDVRLPHYDVTATKRKEALRLGAVEVGRHVTYEHIKKNREKARIEPERKGS